jgi:hypothetical protein
MKIQITFDRPGDCGLVIEQVLELSTKRKILALRNWIFAYLVNPV